MNTVLVFGRIVIWANCPSTQTVPSLSIQPATRMATARTGNGFSAEFGSEVTAGVTSRTRG